MGERKNAQQESFRGRIVSGLGRKGLLIIRGTKQAVEQGPGLEGFKQFFTTLRNAFPDFNIEPEHVVVTNDDVAIAYTLTGTHQETYRSLFEAGRSRVGAEEIG